GGFAGHSSAASRGGFAASAPGRPSSPQARPSGFSSFTAPRAPGVGRDLHRRVARSPFARSPYTGSWRHRRPYVPHYRAGLPYIVPGYGWIAPYFLGYPDDTDYDDSSATSGNGSDGYAMEPP